MEIITHIPRISYEKQNSFWYDGHIASLALPNGNSLIVETKGEIEVNFDEDGETFTGESAVAVANMSGLVDTDLEELLIEDKFQLTNWFGVLEMDSEGEIVNDDLSIIASNYDEAIECLKNYSKSLVE